MHVVYLAVFQRYLFILTEIAHDVLSNFGIDKSTCTFAPIFRDVQQRAVDPSQGEAYRIYQEFRPCRATVYVSNIVEKR